MGAGDAAGDARRARHETLRVALSKEQHAWMVGAIEQWKLVQATPKEMQRLDP